MQKQKKTKLPGNEIFTQFFLSKHSLTDKNIIHKIIVYNEIILVFWNMRNRHQSISINLLIQ